MIQVRYWFFGPKRIHFSRFHRPVQVSRIPQSGRPMTCSRGFQKLDQERVQGLRRASFDETFAISGEYQDLLNHLKIAAGLAQTGAVSQ